jgi:hypothetical protein
MGRGDGVFGNRERGGRDDDAGDVLGAVAANEEPAGGVLSEIEFDDGGGEADFMPEHRDVLLLRDVDHVQDAFFGNPLAAGDVPFRTERFLERGLGQ